MLTTAFPEIPELLVLCAKLAENPLRSPCHLKMAPPENVCVRVGATPERLPGWLMETRSGPPKSESCTDRLKATLKNPSTSSPLLVETNGVVLEKYCREY